ncbi:MAG TPA: hypothetical protein VFM90_11960, partial [Cyclobacteriaceae bacterium]|nr:hypothetical protein [Cyclobacteriaceae bacterium]
EAPFGVGYFPFRCATSGRFTPAAIILTSTSCGPQDGIGRSVICNTLLSPGCVIAIAFMERLVKPRIQIMRAAMLTNIPHSQG